MSTRFRDDPRYAYLSSTPIPRFYGRAQKTPPRDILRGVDVGLGGVPKKPPEGGVLKLRVRTLLTADSATVSLFRIHIKYVSRCYPPPIGY